MSIVSGGTLCLPAMLLKGADIRKAAMPFDWLFCTVDNLIDILQTDFKYFLDDEYIISITDEKGSPEAMNIRYDNGSKGRPLFTHKDPTLQKDKEYYLRCINRFRNLESQKSTLFIIDEFEEIYSKYDELCSTVEKYMPNMKVFAVKHKYTPEESHIETVKENNGHILVNFLSSPIMYGIKFDKPDDDSLLVEYLKSFAKRN